MASLIEFHGRLFRVGADPGGGRLPGEPERRQHPRMERIAEPGSYDLLISLYASREDLDPLWSETHAGVPVSTGGFFGVVLGEMEAVPPGFFDGTPRWLAAAGVGDNPDARSARVPLLGHAIRMTEQLHALSARISALEVAQTKTDRRGVNLHQRLRRAERGDGVTALDARVGRLDGPEGRVAHLEDEVEDVVGPDGDLIDIIERLERIEGVGPGKASVDPRTVEDLSRRIDDLAERVRLLARPRK